jgi:ribosomal protein L37AE/L43A
MKKQCEKCKKLFNELYKTKEGFYLCNKCFKKETGNRPMGRISNITSLKELPIQEDFI